MIELKTVHNSSKTDKYIEYNDQKCLKLVFRISPNTPFQEILAKLNRIQFVGCPISTEHITYSVLELLNNSLRAQREQKNENPILLRFQKTRTGFNIYLRDWGGGFDISELPYDINTNIEEIDIHNQEFEQYRQNHEYMRFGLGLYLARKTFPVFSLFFIDHHEKPTDWNPEITAGTVIELNTDTSMLHSKRRQEYAEPADI